MQIEEILEHLPELLRQKPDLRAKLYAVLVEEFPSRRETDEILREIRELRGDMNRRFEALQQNMDRRFEAMNQRFEAMDRRFEALQQDMDRRFNTITTDLTNHRHWVNVVVGGLQRRAGRHLEDAIAGTIRYAMRMTDVSPDNLRLRQKIVDEQGLIGPRGTKYEYDLLLTNDSTYLFEIKSLAELEDVVRFDQKAEMVRQQLGPKRFHKVLVTLDRPAELEDECRSRGIDLV